MNHPFGRVQDHPEDGRTEVSESTKPENGRCLGPGRTSEQRMVLDPQGGVSLPFDPLSKLDWSLRPHFPGEVW